jgi:AraC-like DNA-binding protein
MAPPAPATSRITTTEPGEAHAWLAAVYTGYEPEESNSHRPFRFQGTLVPLGRSSIARLRYTMSADNNVTPSDVLLVLLPSGGGMRVSRGRSEEVVPAGTAVLFPAHETVSALWADTDATCVCLPAADVERVAVETTGVESEGLQFTGLRPMSASLDRRWSDAVRDLVEAVRREAGALASPVVAGALVQHLAATVLDTFPSTRLDSRRRIPPDHATPAVVRRAADFIEANADRELTLSEIAAASGIGPRGLQAAFLRHRDTTPLAHARRVRLERAHQDLRNADPATPDPVRAVAARWGFADPARFAAAYEQAYGRAPESALRA